MTGGDERTAVAVAGRGTRVYMRGERRICALRGKTLEQNAGAGDAGADGCGVTPSGSFIGFLDFLASDRSLFEPLCMFKTWPQQPASRHRQASVAASRVARRTLEDDARLRSEVAVRSALLRADLHCLYCS